MSSSDARRKTLSTLVRNVALLGALALAGCATEAPAPVEPPDNRAADEAAIRAALDEWAAAAQAKDAQKFASFYAADGILMLEQAPDAVGMAALKEDTAGMMGDPNFSLSFAPDELVVARSGDLAYDVGSYTLTVSDPAGDPMTIKGRYVDVWKKDASGQWKVAVDAPVSDPPAE
jgi:ketosteroid isomerase-like protein